MRLSLILYLASYCDGFTAKRPPCNSLDAVRSGSLKAGICRHGTQIGVSRRPNDGKVSLNPLQRGRSRLTSLFSQGKTTIEGMLNPEKNLLTKAYQRGSYLYFTLAAIILCIPDRTLTVQLATKLGGAAGFAMAAGLCQILAGANTKDRLASETYARLNLGLLAFFAIGILFVPAEAGFFFRSPPAIFLSVILTLAKSYGILLSFLGWKRGVDPAAVYSTETLVQELKQGTIKTMKGLRVKNAKKALAYRNWLLFVGLGIVANIMSANFNLRYSEELQTSWFDVSLNGSAVSRLFMIATMIYTLKDAAERDRLTGTTFIQLNLMLGAWAVLVGFGQAVYPIGIALHRGVEMFAFSYPFWTKAVKALVQKEREKKGSSSIDKPAEGEEAAK